MLSYIIMGICLVAITATIIVSTYYKAQADMIDKESAQAEGGSSDVSPAQPMTTGSASEPLMTGGASLLLTEGE